MLENGKQLKLDITKDGKTLMMKDLYDWIYSEVKLAKKTVSKISDSSSDVQEKMMKVVFGSRISALEDVRVQLDKFCEIEN